MQFAQNFSLNQSYYFLVIDCLYNLFYLFIRSTTVQRSDPKLGSPMDMPTPFKDHKFIRRENQNEMHLL